MFSKHEVNMYSMYLFTNSTSFTKECFIQHQRERTKKRVGAHRVLFLMLGIRMSLTMKKPSKCSPNVTMIGHLLAGLMQKDTSTTAVNIRVYTYLQQQNTFFHSK